MELRYFSSFAKMQALYIEHDFDNTPQSNLVEALEVALLPFGYTLAMDLRAALTYANEGVVGDVYNEIVGSLTEKLGDGGEYKMIYQSFPEGVRDMSQLDFVLNAIRYYRTNGAYEPKAVEGFKRTYAIELTDNKVIEAIDLPRFNQMFQDIVMSGTSISDFDKRVIDWGINEWGITFPLYKIRFKETKAYIGKRMLETSSPLITSSATDILRIYSAWSGGDEGLKENTRFVQPSNSQKAVLRDALEGCNDLEESFKLYREKWLRVLFYLNPFKYAEDYPTLAKYADLIRNKPKQLRTFASYFDEYVKNKDRGIFVLLAKRRGYFMRSLDHLVRVFGVEAVDRFIETSPSGKQLIEVYNHFEGRGRDGERTAILASSGASNVVNYKSLAPLDKELVKVIRERLFIEIKKKAGADNTPVYIDRGLYYTPFARNNRASSFSLGNATTGKTEIASGKCIRMFVLWEGRNDIDLSGMVMYTNGGVDKIGWNDRHTLSGGITYSGDNTGTQAKNAEYLDIMPEKLAESNVEWVIVDANVYRGQSYANWNEGIVKAGWMERNNPEVNRTWFPKTVSNYMEIRSNAQNAYLMAFHVPTSSVVYMDVAKAGQSNVTNSADAIKMKTFLENSITLDDGAKEVSYEKINCGQLLNLYFANVVDNKEDAHIVFDDNTPSEEISKYLDLF